MPETPEKDPIVSESLAGYYLVAALLLIASLGWALFDEFFGLRPWKRYQKEFSVRYSAFLKRQIVQQTGAEKLIGASAEYQELKRQVEEMEAKLGPDQDRIRKAIQWVDQRLSSATQEYTTRRAYVASLNYQIEHTSSERRKKSIHRDIDEYARETVRLSLPALDGGPLERVTLNYQGLEEEFKRLQGEKGRLLSDQANILKPLQELRRKRDTHLREQLHGLTAEQLRGLAAKAESADLTLRQINNADAGIVDRCESCHLGIREPLVLTRKDMGGDGRAGAFTSHPQTELMRIHSSERFGCSPCHNGNGMQVQSVQTAHGIYKHWLWPLHPRDNVEAGCQKCHASDRVLRYAPVLSQGKELFHNRGCVGCHRFQGFDAEPEELISVQQQIQKVEAQRHSNELEVQRSIKEGDEAPDNETARRAFARADNLRVEISALDAQIEQLDYRSRNLLSEVKKIGPNLKEVRVKLRPDWLPVWIQNPHEFRPTTRMPRFRLDEGEVQAVAAFIWQSSLKAKLPSQPPGDAAQGKESFETRGCMGCHSVGEGTERAGGTFAANLTRVGEKAHYDYLVRWIHNPRQRTAPYCPYEKRDLTEEDYKKKGLPFVFDDEHSTCPNDGHELQVQNMTIMPSLRLSWQEARNIASYLLSLKQKDPGAYAPAPFLNDPKLMAPGRTVVQQYGCAGCHEIAGLEPEGRMGTELTEEGSKPIDQIDFGLFKTQAKREGWFNHKGFFERKLAKPEMFDEGMIKAEGETLKMPNFDMPREEITALTTFLLGAVRSEVPNRYFYLPADQRRDVQEGWWTIRKYNCMGCHQLTLDQPSSLMTLARYQTVDGKEQLPPRLVSEGARVNPEWLSRFLSNPALHEQDTDRNGVRPYLRVRMPTFHLSPGEVGKLVRFFQALNFQPLPYIPPRIEPLTPQEAAMARALFTSRAAPCLKCHATGQAAHDRFATAPNFLLGRDRLKPGWTKRWLLDPSMIDPGTAMPSGLFKRDKDRWVFAGPTPPQFGGYEKDHAELLVRYMLQITPQEQARLLGMGGAAGAVASRPVSGRPPRTQAALSGGP